MEILENHFFSIFSENVRSESFGLHLFAYMQKWMRPQSTCLNDVNKPLLVILDIFYHFDEIIT